MTSFLSETLWHLVWLYDLRSMLVSSLLVFSCPFSACLTSFAVFVWFCLKLPIYLRQFIFSILYLISLILHLTLMIVFVNVTACIPQLYLIFPDFVTFLIQNNFFLSLSFSLWQNQFPSAKIMAPLRNDLKINILNNFALKASQSKIAVSEMLLN